MKITPKNWRDFQHYKDRNPPWIRLHKGLLDNYEFQCLPVASRALAPMLWLLASDAIDGVIDADYKKLAFRLRMTEAELIDALKPLIDNKFFDCLEPDSAVLAERLHDAVPETEAETEQKETCSPSASDLVFDEFWKTYPRKVGKDAARKAFDKRKPDKRLLERMVQAIKAQAQSEAWRKDGGQFIPHPSTWLNEGRWLDELTPMPSAKVELFKPEPARTPEQRAKDNEARLNAMNVLKNITPRQAA